MPKIMDLPPFQLDPPSNIIVRVEPFLFWYKRGNIASHHDPKAKILLKANLYITNGDFSLGGGYHGGSHGCRVNRHASVEIDLDDPNALAEFANGAEVIAKLKEIISEVTL